MGDSIDPASLDPTSLDPTLWDRLRQAVRPDFARTLAARRIAAGVLVVLAAAIALRPDPADRRTDVAVSARDLQPGTALSTDDVRMESRPTSTLPDGARTDLPGVLGTTLAGPVRRGEILTDARVLTSRLTGLTTGPQSRIVPLHLNDAAVPDLIRTGDVVDVLGAPDADAQSKPRLLATDAVVVLVSPAGKGMGSFGERVVMVALPAGAAHALAAATLVQTVTLTIH